MDDKYIPDSMMPLPRSLDRRGPEFIGKLKGKHVMLEFEDGNAEGVWGMILKYNPYELLFLRDGMTMPSIVMKHSIAIIHPDPEGPNPFEKKKEEPKPECDNP